MTTDLMMRPDDLKKLQRMLQHFYHEGFMIKVSSRSRITEATNGSFSVRDKSGSMVFTVTHISTGERVGEVILNTNEFIADDRNRRSSGVPNSRAASLIPSKIRELIGNYKLQEEIMKSLQVDSNK
jgi:hypothetical protein